MKETRVLLAHVEDPTQKELATYERKGGYQTLKKIVSEQTPSSLCDTIEASGLRGRGGAGFSTGKKWKFLPKESALPIYLVCNLDESEPGTFKDRWLVEKDPHQLIEGVLLSAYAIQASHAFIYCRGEYFAPYQILKKALLEAREQGYYGPSVVGSSYALSVTLHPGAGAYIAGEETALLESLEGKRAIPRLKPPFPAQEGLYRSPTIVNNVETLCNVVHILQRGVEWFRSLGTEKSRGTKIFQVSGQVRRPGCLEFPFGVSLQDVLEAVGGVLPGRTFKACYPGGSSSALLHKGDLGISMDFETLERRGSSLGTASLIVMDDTADMVQVVHRLMQFYRHESCGKCTPCREGTGWVVQMLARILAGGGCLQDMQKLPKICHAMAANSFCPLAVGAVPPVLSALEHFPNEFLAYLAKNPDSERPPSMPVSYPYRE